MTLPASYRSGRAASVSLSHSQVHSPGFVRGLNWTRGNTRAVRKAPAPFERPSRSTVAQVAAAVKGMRYMTSGRGGLPFVTKRVSRAATRGSLEDVAAELVKAGVISEAQAESGAFERATLKEAFAAQLVWAANEPDDPEAQKEAQRIRGYMDTIERHLLEVKVYLVHGETDGELNDKTEDVVIVGKTRHGAAAISIKGRQTGE
jgi:hypothetical protein